MLSPVNKNNERAEGLLLLLIVVSLAIAGAGWLLYNRVQTEKNGRAYAEETIKKIMVEHDASYMSSNFSKTLRSRNGPAVATSLAEFYARLGVPEQPFTITGEIKFEDYIFRPRGIFRTRLSYPTKHADMTLAASNESGRWQIEAFSVSLADD
jgi:hypothetical protein